MLVKQQKNSTCKHQLFKSFINKEYVVKRTLINKHLTLFLQKKNKLLSNISTEPDLEKFTYQLILDEKLDIEAETWGKPKTEDKWEKVDWSDVEHEQNKDKKKQKANSRKEDGQK